MYWGFFFRLLGGSFLAPILFSFMLVPLLGLVALTARNGGAKLSPTSYLMLAVVFVAQLYFWAGWAAYCAALAVIRASDPSVSYPWLYYLTAFLFLSAPIGYLSSKEQASAESAGEVRGIQGGTVLYKVLTFIAFAVFCFFPELMLRPYGWFLGLVVA